MHFAGTTIQVHYEKGRPAMIGGCLFIIGLLFMSKLMQIGQLCWQQVKITVFSID